MSALPSLSEIAVALAWWVSLSLAFVAGAWWASRERDIDDTDDLRP